MNTDIWLKLGDCSMLVTQRTRNKQSRFLMLGPLPKPSGYRPLLASGWVVAVHGGEVLQIDQGVLSSALVDTAEHALRGCSMNASKDPIREHATRTRRKAAE
jgi:hypothetical protein